MSVSQYIYFVKKYQDDPLRDFILQIITTVSMFESVEKTDEEKRMDLELQKNTVIQFYDSWLADIGPLIDNYTLTSALQAFFLSFSQYSSVSEFEVINVESYKEWPISIKFRVTTPRGTFTTSPANIFKSIKFAGYLANFICGFLKYELIRTSPPQDEKNSELSNNNQSAVQEPIDLFNTWSHSLIGSILLSRLDYPFTDVGVESWNLATRQFFHYLSQINNENERTSTIFYRNDFVTIISGDMRFTTHIPRTDIDN